MGAAPHGMAVNAPGIIPLCGGWSGQISVGPHPLMSPVSLL
jgi:hypothetical protein